VVGSFENNNLQSGSIMGGGCYDQGIVSSLRMALLLGVSWIAG